MYVGGVHTASRFCSFNDGVCSFARLTGRCYPTVRTFGIRVPARVRALIYWISRKRFRQKIKWVGIFVLARVKGMKNIVSKPFVKNANTFEKKKKSLVTALDMDYYVAIVLFYV